MANELDDLIRSLKRQREDVQTQMTSSNREQSAAELVDKLQRLRKRAEEIDETWRGQHNR